MRATFEGYPLTIHEGDWCGPAELRGVGDLEGEVVRTRAERVMHPTGCPTSVPESPGRVLGPYARQGDVIRKILQHCGLWHDPPPRAPPGQSRPSQAARPTHDADGGITYEVDPDFLEHVRREAREEPELPWDVQK